jgi:hypothetical protein
MPHEEPMSRSPSPGPVRWAVMTGGMTRYANARAKHDSPVHPVALVTARLTRTAPHKALQATGAERRPEQHRLPGGPEAQGAVMTPEGRMRAAEALKSCADSWDTKEMALPPGTGWPCAVNWTG